MKQIQTVVLTFYFSLLYLLLHLLNAFAILILKQVIVPRPGYDMWKTFFHKEENVTICGYDHEEDGIGLVSSDVSSSLVKERMEGRGGMDDGAWAIEGLVPMAVSGYIQRYNLYR